MAEYTLKLTFKFESFDDVAAKSHATAFNNWMKNVGESPSNAVLVRHGTSENILKRGPKPVENRCGCGRIECDECGKVKHENR